MPQFEVTTFPTQIFWLFVCFIFLCIVMRLFVVPRLTAAIETREQRIQEDWNQSKTLINSREALRKETLESLAQARGNAHSILHQAIQEIHHRKSNRLAMLEEELSIKTKNIRDDLESRTQKILGNIEPLVSQVVKATSGRILGESLSPAEAKKCVLRVLKKGEKP